MNSAYSLRNLLIINFLIHLTIATDKRLGDPPVRGNHPPNYWSHKTRTIYLQTRTGHYIEVCPGDKIGIRGVHEKTDYAILEELSGENLSVIIKGAHSGLYICMDSNSQLYPSKTISEDCYFKETYHHAYNVYHHRSHRERKTKFYIGIDRTGKARKGIVSRKSQKMSQFTPLDYKNDSVRSSSECISGNIHLVDSEKVKREQTRKRRRRWCKHLLSGKLERNPVKYTKRCKHDCEILKQMLDSPRKYKRKCLKAKRKRRLRKLREKLRGQRGHRRHVTTDARTLLSTTGA